MVSLPELPAVEVTGVVLANELLDNLAFGLVERSASGWLEVRVGADDRGELREVLVPCPSHDEALAGRLAPDAAVGSRLPVQRQGVDWVGRALSGIERGRLVVVDYADHAPHMAARPWSEWVRTYRSHARGGSPLRALGTQDITCEVELDQLASVHRPGAVRSQAEFLTEHGIDELVDEGRQVWRERAHLGDLEAIRARSRVREAEALVDPSGLGGFRVLEWPVA